jgi:Ca2+-binding RTX toxin-like protein
MTDFGPEFIVNSTTEHDQHSQTATALPDGRFVVSWLSDSGNVRARLFDANGNAVGSDFVVNTTSTSGLSHPTVTALADGHFVVTWSDDGPGHDIRARLFDANGNPLGSDFVVNSATVSQIHPTVTALPNSHFVVTWMSSDNGADYDIRARLFDANGNPVGSDFVVNSTTASDQGDPTVTALPDGHFVVTWHSYDGDGSGVNIRARLFDASGNAVASDFVVNSTTVNDQFRPTVTALPDGRFVVTWFSFDDEVNGDIRARLFNANGNALASDFLVNSTTAGPQTNSTVTALPDGHFLVTWQSSDEAAVDWDVRARLFDANGTAVGSDFLVNSATLNVQTLPTVTALPDGQVVVTWTSSGDGSGTAIRARILSFDTNAAPVITSDGGVDTAAVSVAENATAVTTVTATDQDARQTLDFSIVGGADAGLFTINATTGVLSFATAPDFEAPTDANGDNVYEVTVQVSDGNGGIDTQAMAVTVQNVAGATPPSNNAANTLTGTGEEETLIGLGGNDTLYGLAGNDTLDGGTGNDTLDGGTGSDTMAGGAGNDMFVVDNIGDSVVENAGGGTDTLRTSLETFTLAALGNVEHLTFIGAGNFSGSGNGLANTITGGGGTDALDGAGGADRLVGLGGDDTYFVDSPSDVIVEVANAGTDTALAASGTYSLSANVEHLVFVGTGDFRGTGNGLANAITGGVGADTLSGDGGADTLIGQLGSDTLAGGTGDDTFLATLGDGNDSYAGGGGRDTYSLAGTTARAAVDLAAGTASSSETGLDALSSVENEIGGAGADSITANNSANVFTGGAGGDTFVFATIGAAGNGTNRDQITDFATGDVIDVGGIDANGGQVGDLSFDFIGAVTNVVNGLGQLGRGQLGYHYETDASGVEHTIIEGNVNANAAADFQIDLIGQLVLTGNDLLL